jgi:hypothetical protein
VTSRTFVIVGSRGLTSIPAHILAYISKLDGKNTIGLRCPLYEPPQPFESLLAQVCNLMGIEVRWYQPELDSGREGVYYRDIDMVRDADCVLAFFAGETMIGGTEHVVEKALDQQVPVYSYGIRDGKWVMLGSNDPYDIWPHFTI